MANEKENGRTRCPECAHEVEDHSNFCPKCGKQLKDPVEIIQYPRSWAKKENCQKCQANSTCSIRARE